jgi:hypothetical protein
MPCTIKVGMTKVENKQNHLSIPKLSGIFYQFRGDVQTYSHQPRYTADDNAAGIDVQAQKCQPTGLSPC